MTTDGPNSQDASPADSSAVSKLSAAREKIAEQLSRLIVGQDQVIEELLISLFSRGHCLLEGVPGLAKTLLVSTLARTLGWRRALSREISTSAFGSSGPDAKIPRGRWYLKERPTR